MKRAPKCVSSRQKPAYIRVDEPDPRFGNMLPNTSGAPFANGLGMKRFEQLRIEDQLRIANDLADKCRALRGRSC